MKVAILFLTIFISTLAFSQEKSVSALDKLTNKEGIVYKKRYFKIGELPSQFNRSSLKVLKLSTINSSSNVESYIILNGVQVIGSSRFDRYGILTIDNCKTLLNFLSFANDSLFGRNMNEHEEFYININSDITATFYSSDQTWNLAISIDTYNNFDIFFKQSDIVELIQHVGKAITIASRQE